LSACSARRRAAELGDSGWRTLLSKHDALVREEVARHRGRLIKSLGDGMLATFDGPSRAISGLAATGEVLVSSTVRDLTVGSGQALAHRGEHALKGVPGSWGIFAVRT
jgi:class 3 adenylate cyclase